MSKFNQVFTNSIHQMYNSGHQDSVKSVNPNASECYE